MLSLIECLGFPKQCIVGYSLTCPIRESYLMGCNFIINPLMTIMLSRIYFPVSSLSDDILMQDYLK